MALQLQGFLAGPLARLFWQVQGFSWSALRRAGFHLTWAISPINNPDNWVGAWVLWIGGGLGGEVAIEAVVTNRWLVGIFGKWGLKSGQNLVWRSVETFETVHGKPFYTRAGIYPLAAS